MVFVLIPVASKAHTLNEGAELPQESKEAPILKSKKGSMLGNDFR